MKAQSNLTSREEWKTKLGFIWSAIGSAVGLGSIWRFPYVVGENGGAVFIFLFLLFLFFISLPLLIMEIAIGRKTAQNPEGAFQTLGMSRVWGTLGLLQIITGFLVSSFYSIVCGWTLGYLITILVSGLQHFQTLALAKMFFSQAISSPTWALLTHFTFLGLATLILYRGVQRGIEFMNKVFMPVLVLLLVFLVIKGYMMKGGYQAVAFLVMPDFSKVTLSTVMIALGQAFFALSIGQGTMITYGSYMSKKENILTLMLPIVLVVAIVSLLSGMAIFSVVFSFGLKPEEGVNLMFQTLPLIFSEMKGGYIIGVIFFILIFLAGITSQISAMEPLIAYLIDRKKMTRRRGVLLCGVGVFLLGIPSALSFGLWKDYTWGGKTFFDVISFISINVLIPLGALFSIILVGWKWKMKSFLDHLMVTEEDNLFLVYFLKFSIQYLSPFIIGSILLDLLL